jgi:predicted nucleic acid-binding protein
VPDYVLAWDLGAGESQVLSMALAYNNATVVLDDLPARRCAQTLNVPVIGTLGIILRAKRVGLITAARPLFEELLRTGMYIDPNVVNQALAEVGE